MIIYYYHLFIRHVKFDHGIHFYYANKRIKYYNIYMGIQSIDTIFSPINEIEKFAKKK